MTHVVLESCIRCKYTDCVDVCPVDCFREGPNMLVIDPDECIDCAVCIPECPVNAILPEEDVPTEQLAFIKLNAELAVNWPSITKRKAPLLAAAALLHAGRPTVVTVGAGAAAVAADPASPSARHRCPTPTTGKTRPASSTSWPSKLNGARQQRRAANGLTRPA